MAALSRSPFVTAHAATLSPHTGTAFGWRCHQPALKGEVDASGTSRRRGYKAAHCSLFISTPQSHFVRQLPVRGAFWCASHSLPLTRLWRISHAVRRISHCDSNISLRVSAISPRRKPRLTPPRSRRRLWPCARRPRLHWQMWPVCWQGQRLCALRRFPQGLSPQPSGNAGTSCRSL